MCSLVLPAQAGVGFVHEENGQPARKADCGPQGAWHSPRRTAWKRSHALVVLPVAHPAAQHWKEALWRCSHPIEGRSGRDPSAETFPRSALRTASFVRASLLVSSEVPDVQRPSGAGVFRRRPRWSAAAAHGRSRRTAPAGHRLPEKAAADKRAQRGGTEASRSSGTTTEDLARRVPHVSCPTCKAPEGKPCSVPGSHQARFQRAQTQRRP